MKKLLFAVIAFSLLATGSSIAEPTHPNEVGLYTTPDGYGATGTSVIGSPVEVYLVLTRPTDVNNGDAPYPTVNAFECTLRFDPIPNNNLFKLYIASHRLHSSLALGEVLDVISEIILNLVGADAYSIQFFDEPSGQLLPVVVRGIDRDAVKPVRIGDGIIGNISRSYDEGLDLTTVVVPEPSTLALLGLAGLGLVIRSAPFYRSSAVVVLLPREKPTVDATVVTSSLESTRERSERSDSAGLLLPPIPTSTWRSCVHVESWNASQPRSPTASPPRACGPDPTSTSGCSAGWSISRRVSELACPKHSSFPIVTRRPL